MCGDISGEMFPEELEDFGHKEGNQKTKTVRGLENVYTMSPLNITKLA